MTRVKVEAAGDGRARSGPFPADGERRGRRRGGAGAVSGASEPSRLRPLLLVAHAGRGGAGGAAVLAVGRALRHHRERLRQGAHRPDLGGGRRPHPRGARARPRRGQGRRHPLHPRPGAVPRGARQGRGRARLHPQPGAHPDRHLARGQERAAGGREQGRLLEHPAGAPEDAGRARHRLLQQARGGREQRHRRRRSRLAWCARRSSASPPSWSAIRSVPSTSTRWCARSRPSASGPRSTSPAP